MHSSRRFPLDPLRRNASRKGHGKTADSNHVCRSGWRQQQAGCQTYTASFCSPETICTRYLHTPSFSLSCVAPLLIIPPPAASKVDSRLPTDQLPNVAASSVASASRKRKGAASDDTEQHASKTTKIGPGPVQKPSRAAVSNKSKTTTAEVPRSRAPITPLNQAPTQALAIFPVGSGDCGELGLGPSQTGVYRPRFNPYLDPNGPPSKFRVVQLSCGGMHTIALTADSKIITWGVNDNHALGRGTEWDGGFRDIDAGSGHEEDGELNPYESTPSAIPSSNFPPDTRFVQVAAGDSCSFALTDRGLVYGWGTFRVGLFLFHQNSLKCIPSPLLTS